VTVPALRWGAEAFAYERGWERLRELLGVAATGVRRGGSDGDSVVWATGGTVVGVR
jgi:hypothetical protein